MKKNYQKPQMQVVNINSSVQLLTSGSQITSVNSGGVFSNSAPQAGSGDARSRGGWFDDDWDEE